MAKAKIAETALALDSMKAEQIAKSEGLSATRVLAQAERLCIDTAATYEASAVWLKDIKGRMKAIEDQRTELVKPLNGVVKQINELFRRPMEILGQAEVALKQKLLGYQRAEERRVKEENDRLWLAAQKEEEKLRERAEKRAVKAEERGDLAKAEAIRETLPTVPVQSAASAEVPKLAGLRMTTYWKVEVVELGLLIQAVAAGEAPQEALLADQVYLNSVVREQRDTLRWPGLRVWSEEGLSSGRK